MRIRCSSETCAAVLDAPELPPDVQMMRWHGWTGQRNDDGDIEWSCPREDL